MSILSSVGAGKLQYINKYFEEKFPKLEVNILKRASFDIKTSGDEYTVVLKPLYKFGYLNLDLKELPCNVDFENMPSIHLMNANKETIKKLPKYWRIKCNEYKLENTTFMPPDMDFVLDYHEKIYNSTIYLLDNFDESCKGTLQNLAVEAVLQSNVVMIKYIDEFDYKQLDIAEWERHPRP